MLRTSRIVTPAASALLTSLAAVKADLGITDTTSDAWLTATITRASAAILADVGRPLAAETIDETFTACGSSRMQLVLSRCPVISITSIAEDGVALAGSDYVLAAGAGLLHRRASGLPVPWSASITIITYIAGYATIPADVDAICLAMVRTAWFARGRDPSARSETVEGIGATTWTTGAASMPLTPDLAAALDPYRELAV